MNKGRLEAFSDGVFAIIITIMVLDLRVPSGPSLEALRSTVPVFLSYVLSFVYVGIYWNNHHHLLQLPSAFPDQFSGLTCICCSGFRWRLSRPDGSARITMLPGRSRSMA